MKRLQSVDVVRVGAIIAVISIHTEPFSSPSVPVGERLDVATLINQIARFAVPFFFILSGYFWARKIAAGTTVISATLPLVRRIAFLLFFWSLVYLLPTDLFASLEHGLSGPIRVSYWNLNNAISRPFDILLKGTMYHLWYLPAMICSLMISALLLYYRQRSLLVVLALALFLTGIAGGSYRSTVLGFESDFNFRNGPFFSLIFFVSGYLLYHRQTSRFLLPIGFVIASLGAGLQYYEISMLHDISNSPMIQDYVFGTYFFGIGISMIAISGSSLLQSSWADKVGPLGLGIYASHMMFVNLLSPLDKKFEGNWIWSILYMALVFLLSYVLASFLARFNATKKLVM